MAFSPPFIQHGTKDSGQRKTRVIKDFNFDQVFDELVNSGVENDFHIIPSLLSFLINTSQNGSQKPTTQLMN